MKYFVVADVHGYFTEMLAALNKAGYNMFDHKHIFVSLGDLFDRGPQPKECLNFVNAIPDENKILIRGNHEALLDEALFRGSLTSADVENGTAATICSLANDTHADTALTNLRFNRSYADYCNNLRDYYETARYIFVHGWIPTLYTYGGKMYFYKENWRCSTEGEWNNARWTNGMQAWDLGAKEPNKTILCGHWHASWGHTFIEGKGPEFKNGSTLGDFTPFYGDGITALDACTAFSGFVNCVVLED